MKARSKSTAAWIIVLSMLAWAATTQAQDDPFAPEGEDDLGPSEEEAPVEAPPVDDLGPEGAPEPEATPEPAAEPEVYGDTPAAEGEAEGEVGGSFEAGVDIAAPEVAAEGAAPIADEEEIVVTGSRIKRTTYSLPSSVEVVTREELGMSGATNMADVVKYLAINSGSNFNTDVSTGAGGTAQFNLRGMGLNATLVLLNGRRLVQSGAAAGGGQNFTDINSIPLQFVERIEILKGGASAIYGSDAVAGVVNIITRRNVDGFEAQVGGQTTDDFDQDEWDVSLTGGAQGPRTRVNGTVMYFERSPLDAPDRDFTQPSVQFTDTVETLGNMSRAGQPGLFVVPAAPLLFYRDGNCAQGPLSAPSPTEAELDQLVASGATERTDLPNGEALYTRIDANGDGVTDADDPPLCTFNFNPFFDLVIEEQRANTYVTVDHDISYHTRMFFEAGYSRNRSERGLSPSFPVLQNLVIPPSNQYNPTGQTLIWRGRPLGAEAGPTTQFYESDTFHTVAGLGGDFGGLAPNTMLEDWEWEIAGTWSMNQYYFGLSDSLTDPLADAIASCGPMDDPADCFNPFYMRGAPNSQEVIDRITGELRSKTDTELTTAGASLSGPLFELPGGDFAYAIGGQVRHESARVDVDHDANQENYVFLIGGPDYTAERDILAAYAELVMPFVEGFELQAAGRVEDYDDVGSTFDPKLGLSWTPAETFSGGQEVAQASKIRLRGTYATSFRAPSLLQTDGAGTALISIRDVRPDDMGNPVRADSDTFRAARTFGNPDLEPETSTAITAGLEYEPVDGLKLEGDYWLYNYDKIIVVEDPQELLFDDFACSVPEAQRPAGCDPGIIRDTATGDAQQITVEYVNARSVDASGIDFNLNYRSDFGGNAGTFSFGATGTYVLGFEIPAEDAARGYAQHSETECSGDTCDVAGFRNSANFATPIPTLRVNFPLGWMLDGHAVGVIPRLIGGYKNDTIDFGAAQEESMEDIDAFFTIDLQYSLRIDEGDNLASTVKLGVQNLLDTDPPSVTDGLGYDPLTHDPRGRLLYARLIQEF